MNGRRVTSVEEERKEKNNSRMYFKIGKTRKVEIDVFVN